MISNQYGPLIAWLQEDDDPSVACRTYIELCDYKPDDEIVKTLKHKIPQSPQVQSILDKMHPDGYWLQQNERTKEWLGDGVEYGAFGTTHYCLSYLSELGMDKNNVQINKAAGRYLELQKDDGDWYKHFSCLSGLNIRTFIRLGYGDDKRIRRSIELLLNTIRNDNGYLCEIHENKSQTKKSCIRGSVKALLAFSELPDHWQHPRCLALIDYFLHRNGIYQVSHPNEYVNDDMKRFSFPTSWRANTWEILYALSKMGYGNDERLSLAWEMMEQKKETDGKYILDWTPTQSPWKVGKRGKPNKWITFYILLAKKHKENATIR